jgi:hypothetical protein
LSASATVATNSDSDSDSVDSKSNDLHKISNSKIQSVHSADYISEHHNEVVEDASLQVVRTKHQLQGIIEETKPKFVKALNGSHQQLKASDFDEVTKDLLAIAMSIYQCLIMTQEPFPVMLVVEMKLAREAWHETSNLAGLTVKDHTHRCIQSLRGVSMTGSEGLWPQLINCAPHLSMVPLISDKVQ